MIERLVAKFLEATCGGGERVWALLCVFRESGLKIFNGG